MDGREQLELWVAGESVHNPEADECCPDFSCCAPLLKAPREERDAFFKAWECGDVGIMESFLSVFKQRADTFAEAQRFVANQKAIEEGVILKELPI